MILGMLLLGLAQALPQPTGHVVRSRQSLTLPPEIAPAVIPYLQCLMEDDAERLLGADSGDIARAAIRQLLEDCRAIRDRSEAGARQMLESSSIPAAERERMISEALSSIDHSRDEIAERLDRQ